MIEGQSITRTIEGFEGYEITSDGRVWSKPKHCHNGMWLSPYKDPTGYLRVTLCRDGEVNPQLVHRLVATAFIPNPENKPQINHIDGNTTNNAVSNLEWNTPAENITHSIKVLGNRIAGERNGRSKLTNTAINDIRAKYIPRLYTLKMLANEYGVSTTLISFVVNRKNWNHINGEQEQQ